MKLFWDFFTAACAIIAYGYLLRPEAELLGYLVIYCAVMIITGTFNALELREMAFGTYEKQEINWDEDDELC